MRVLMIGPARSVHGGISAMVNNYYGAGLDRKVSLHYIGTMVDGSRLRKLLQAVGAWLLFLICMPWCQIVHVNMASDSSYYRKSVFIKTARFFRKKIVLHQHGGDFQTFYGGLPERGKRLLRRVLDMADVMLVLTPSWKCFFGTLTRPEKILVFPNTVAVSPRRGKAYWEHEILFLGRLCREKGISELLYAVRQLREEFPDLKLYLGGVWEDAALQKEAEALGDTVCWLGWVTGEEKKKYLEKCGIFALPSWFEGQPVALMEAMEASCAVAASDVGGIPHIVQDGQNGLLIRPKDGDSLTEGLRRLLADAALCRRLGENARETVEASYSLEKSVGRLLEIYEEVLNGNRTCKTER